MSVVASDLVGLSVITSGLGGLTSVIPGIPQDATDAMKSST
jgi:hypothetical protein